MNKKVLSFHRRLNKLAALVSLFFFSFSNISMAQGPLGISIGSDQTAVPLMFDRVTIPKELGSVQVQSVVPNKKPFIVFIQDAHAITDAQLNMQKLIDYLGATYGIHLIALEGGEGKLDPTIFRAFPEKAVKAKVMRGYLERGELGGPELAAILNPVEDDYYGIENWKLYESNYIAYLRAAKNRDLVLKDLEGLKKKFDEKRKTVYSPKLNAFHEKLRAFQDERSHLLEFLRYLKSLEEMQAKLDQYPELKKMAESIKKDSEMNKESLEISVRNLADAFKAKKINALPSTEVKEFNGKYQDFVTAHLDAAGFLKYLISKAEALGLRLRLTPEMKELLGHAETLSMIKGTKLFDELKALIREMEKELAQKQEERELQENYHRIDLLKDLSRLEIDRDQLDDYQKSPDAYLGLLTDPKTLTPALEFYRYALERDEALYQNLEKMIQEKKAQAAIVILGGFHARGVERKLKGAGNPYMIVTPKIESLTGQENYEQVMEGKLSYKDQLTTSFYDAFVKHSSLKMVSELNEPDFRRMIKTWRDAIIRQLASEGRVEKSGEYTKYIDLLTKVYIEKFGTKNLNSKSREDILKEVEAELNRYKDETLKTIWSRFEFQLKTFTSGLKGLIDRKELNAENAKTVLDQAMAAKPASLKQLSTVALLKDMGKADSLDTIAMMKGQIPAENVNPFEGLAANVPAQAVVELAREMAAKGQGVLSPQEAASIVGDVAGVVTQQGEIQKATLERMADDIKNQAAPQNLLDDAANKLLTQVRQQVVTRVENKGLTDPQINNLVAAVLDEAARQLPQTQLTLAKPAAEANGTAVRAEVRAGTTTAAPQKAGDADKEARARYQKRQAEILAALRQSAKPLQAAEEKRITDLIQKMFDNQILFEDDPIELLNQGPLARIFEQLSRFDINSYQFERAFVREVMHEMSTIRFQQVQKRVDVNENIGKQILDIAKERGIPVLGEEAPIRLMPGEILIQEGTTQPYLYILVEGTADLNVAGKKQLTLAPGAAVGENSAPLRSDIATSANASITAGPAGVIVKKILISDLSKQSRKVLNDVFEKSQARAERQKVRDLRKLRVRMYQKYIALQERGLYPAPTEKVERKIPVTPDHLSEQASSLIQALSRDLFPAFRIFLDPNATAEQKEAAQRLQELVERFIRENGGYDIYMPGEVIHSHEQGHRGNGKYHFLIEGSAAVRSIKHYAETLPDGTRVRKAVAGQANFQEGEGFAAGAVSQQRYHELELVAERKVIAFTMNQEQYATLVASLTAYNAGLEEGERLPLSKEEVNGALQQLLVQRYEGYDQNQLYRIKDFDEINNNENIPIETRLALYNPELRRGTLFGKIQGYDFLYYDARQGQWFAIKSKIQRSIKNLNEDRRYLLGHRGQSLNYQKELGLSNQAIRIISNSLEDLENPNQIFFAPSPDKPAEGLFMNEYFITSANPEQKRQLERRDLYFVETDQVWKREKPGEKTPGAEYATVTFGMGEEGTEVMSVEVKIPDNGIVDPVRILNEDARLKDRQDVYLVNIRVPTRFKVRRLNKDTYNQLVEASGEFSIDSFINKIEANGFDLDTEDRATLQFLINETLRKYQEQFPAQSTDLSQAVRLEIFRVIGAWMEFDKIPRTSPDTIPIKASLTEIQVLLEQYLNHRDLNKFPEGKIPDFKDVKDSLGKVYEGTLGTAYDAGKFLSPYGTLNKVWDILHALTDKRLDPAKTWMGEKLGLTLGLDLSQRRIVAERVLADEVRTVDFSQTKNLFGTDAQGKPKKGSVKIIPDKHEMLEDFDAAARVNDLVDDNGNVKFEAGQQVIFQGDLFNRLGPDWSGVITKFQIYLEKVEKANQEHPESEPMKVVYILGNHEKDILLTWNLDQGSAHAGGMSGIGRPKIQDLRKLLFNLLRNGQLVVGNYLGDPALADNPLAGIQMYHSLITQDSSLFVLNEINEQEELKKRRIDAAIESKAGSATIEGLKNDLDEFRKQFPRNFYGVAQRINFIFQQELIKAAGDKKDYDGTETFDFTQSPFLKIVLGKSVGRKGTEKQSGVNEFDANPFAGNDLEILKGDLGLENLDDAKVTFEGAEVSLKQIMEMPGGKFGAFKKQFKGDLNALMTPTLAFTKAKLEKYLENFRRVASDKFFNFLKAKFDEVSRTAKQPEDFIPFTELLLGNQIFGHNMNGMTEEGVRPVRPFSKVAIADTGLGQVATRNPENRNGNVVIETDQNGQTHLYATYVQVRPMSEAEKGVSLDQAYQYRETVRQNRAQKDALEKELREKLKEREKATAVEAGAIDGQINGLQQQIDQLEKTLDNPEGNPAERPQPTATVATVAQQVEASREKNVVLEQVLSREKVPPIDRMKLATYGTLEKDVANGTLIQANGDYVLALSGTFEVVDINGNRIGDPFVIKGKQDGVLLLQGAELAGKSIRATGPATILRISTKEGESAKLFDAGRKDSLVNTLNNIIPRSPAIPRSELREQTPTAVVDLRRDLSADLIAQKTALRANSWGQVLDFMFNEDGTPRQAILEKLDVIFVDIDNTMHNPGVEGTAGYLGSERERENMVRKLTEKFHKDEKSPLPWKEAKNKAKQLAFIWTGLDEQRLVKNGFLRRAGNLSVQDLQRLRLLRENGIRIVGLTARDGNYPDYDLKGQEAVKNGKDVRGRTLDMLQKVGIQEQREVDMIVFGPMIKIDYSRPDILGLDEVIFTEKGANGKVEQMERYLSERKLQKAKAILVDDLPENTATMREKGGLSTVDMNEQDPNGLKNTVEDYVRFARENPGENKNYAFEFLLNAFVIAPNKVAEDQVLEQAKTILEAERFQAFKAEAVDKTILFDGKTYGRKDITGPHDGGKVGNYTHPDMEKETAQAAVSAPTPAAGNENSRSEEFNKSLDAVRREFVKGRVEEKNYKNYRNNELVFERTNNGTLIWVTMGELDLLYRGGSKSYDSNAYEVWYRGQRVDEPQRDESGKTNIFGDDYGLTWSEREHKASIDEEGEINLELTQLYLKNEFQRKRIGAQIFDYLVGRLKRLGEQKELYSTFNFNSTKNQGIVKLFLERVDRNKVRFTHNGRVTTVGPTPLKEEARNVRETMANANVQGPTGTREAAARAEVREQAPLSDLKVSPLVGLTGFNQTELAKLINSDTLDTVADVNKLSETLLAAAQKDFQQIQQALEKDLADNLTSASLKKMADIVNGVFSKEFEDAIKGLPTLKNDTEAQNQLLQRIRLTVLGTTAVISGGLTLTQDQIRLVQTVIDNAGAALRKAQATSDVKIDLVINYADADMPVVAGPLGKYSEVIDQLFIVYNAKEQKLNRSSFNSTGILTMPIPLDNAHPEKVVSRIEQSASNKVSYVLTADPGALGAALKDFSIMAQIGQLTDEATKKLVYEAVLLSVLQAARLSPEEADQLQKDPNKMKEFLKRIWDIKMDVPVIKENGVYRLDVFGFVQGIVQAAEEAAAVAKAA